MKNSKASLERSGQLLGKRVFPILIPTPFYVGDVFCYLVKDEKIVLIDCGQYEDRAYDRVVRALKEQGLTLRDVDEIWLTHGHPDHFGQAARLADESGAQVYGHAKERANFAGSKDRRLFSRFFEYHAIPSDLTDHMLEQLDWLGRYEQPVVPEWLEDGAAMTSGSLNFEAVHTPGHAPGHLVYRESTGLLFGGDLLLEHISTNALINFDPDGGTRNKSLLQYRRSLEWISRQHGLVLPGHGNVIRNITGVAERHLADHAGRLAGVKTLLDDRPASLLDLAHRMFPGPMNKGAEFLVLSEVIGYLDWGTGEGEIEEYRHNGQVMYRLA